MHYLQAMNRRRFITATATTAIGAGLYRPGMALADPALPKIALIGDSIRLDYSPFVIEALAGKATVFSPTDNGGHTINVLKFLHLWVQKEQPDLVHVNCGLHDLKTLAYGAPATDNLVPLHQYAENIERIFTFIRTYSKARIIWATTTPVDEKLVHADHAQYKDFDRHESAVLAYNAAAVKVCAKMKVDVDDLYRFCTTNDLKALQKPDGVHFTDAGSRKLGTEVGRLLAARL